MGKKSLKTLTKELEMRDGNRYLNYLCEVLINGQPTALDNELNEMRKSDLKMFLQQVNRGDYDHMLRYKKEDMINHILKYL